MHATLTAVVAAAAITALAALLAPEGKNKKWVTFVFSLVAFAVICVPLLDALRTGADTPALPDESATASDSALSFVLSYAEEPLARALASEIGLPPGEVSVSLSETPDGGIRIDAAVPAGYESAAETCLSAQCSNECEVHVRGR